MKLINFSAAHSGVAITKDMQAAAAAANALLHNGQGEGNDFLGWVDLPVIMYHSVGEKTGKYVISPEMLEEDFASEADNNDFYVNLDNLADIEVTAIEVEPATLLLEHHDIKRHYNKVTI